MSFLNAFIETMLHSLWQAGLLVICYGCLNVFLKKTHPIDKRNLLFSILIIQILMTSFTFIGFYTQNNFQFFQQISSRFYLTKYFKGYTNIAFIFYVLIVATRFFAVMVKWKSFKINYTESLSKPHLELKLFTELKTYQLGLKRKVTLWYCNNIQAPITFGFIKPIILLPFSLVNSISQQEAEAIILHELAHIKNKDFLINWLMIGIEIIYFFNPFIKIIIEKIKLEREKNCDVQVLEFEYDKILYAQTLLKIAKNKIPDNSFQLNAVKTTSQLLKRISFFCDENNLQFKKNNTSYFTYLLLPLFFVLTTLILPSSRTKSKALVVPYPIMVTKEKSLYPTNMEMTKPIENKVKLVQDMVAKTSKQIISSHSVRANIDITKLDDRSLSFQFASFNENNDSIKEFIYNIETNQGKLIQSYKLVLVNDQWVLQPLWMMLETNTDSVQLLRLDSLRTIIDSIQ